jgi:hypothetical protein
MRILIILRMHTEDFIISCFSDCRVITIPYIMTLLPEGIIHLEDGQRYDPY